MAKLNFKNEGLRNLIERVRQAKQFKNNSAEAIKAYQKETGKNWSFDVELDRKFYETTTPAFWFVKDRGIYLMSNAKVEDKDIPTTNADLHVVYATGYDPRQSDVWEKCQDAVGGDDFCDQILLDEKMIKAIELGYNMVIDFSVESFTYYFYKPPVK
jgi:hypothetical protein